MLRFAFSRLDYPGLIHVLAVGKLNVIALLMLGSVLLAGALHLAHILATPSNMAVLRNWVALGLILGVFAIGEGFRRKGQQQRSVLLLCYAVIGILCFTIAKSVGGLRASEIIYLPIALTLAGWLLGGRHALILFILESATLLLVLWVNPAPSVFGGQDPRAVGLSPHWLVWLVQQAGLTIATALSITIGSMFHATLKNIEHASLTDVLTALPNRRAFEHFYNTHFEHCQQHQQTMSLIVLDLDHFKHINDTFSHLAGDRALVQLSQLLLKSCASWNSTLERAHLKTFCARLGGDEFAIVLPGATQAQALQLARTCVLEARAHTWTLSDTVSPQTLTISVGVGEFNDCMSSSEDLYQLADAALYQVKLSGRNNAGTYGTYSSGKSPARRKTDTTKPPTS